METTHASVRNQSTVGDSLVGDSLVGDSLVGDSLVGGSTVRVPAIAGRLLAIACVGLFGIGLVWAAGFANADTLHNAAHDSRHSLVFPCH